MDVVKTRLQVKPTEGQYVYKGWWDCAGRIRAEEGPRAFFKGSIQRCLIVAPLFGITLLS